jgi:hypothetical protein
VTKDCETSPVQRARVVLEACPPALDDRDKAYAVLRQSFSIYNNFHAISVPDLQDEAEFNRQRQRVPNEEFAAWLAELTNKPLSLYKVSVASTEPALRRWLADAKALGCRDIFLVGGDSTDAVRPQGTLELGAAAALVRESGFGCGGIIIPTRRKNFMQRPAAVDERDRLLAKIHEHHFSFFSTQILYESEWMCCLMLDLVRVIERERVPKIFLTFSPLVCEEDLNFAKKTLGVYIPSDTERRLRGARSMREASISGLIEVWDRIFSFARDIGFPLDRLGVNIEYLDSRNPRNVDAAFELAEEFGRMFTRRREMRASDS